MSMTTRQKEILNAFGQQAAHDWIRSNNSDADPVFNLGTFLDDGSVASDPVRDKFSTVAFTVPAPAAGAATKDFIAFKAPAAGSIISVEVLPTAAWSAGNAAGDAYLLSARRYNNTPADLAMAHDLVSGVAAGSPALLPTGAVTALLTTGQNFALTVSGANLTITNAVAFVNTPAVGDFISILSTATNARGATPSNPGVYRITSVSSTVIVATKLFGTNPEAVVSVAAGASDTAGLVAVSQSGAAFAAGDTIGLRFIVPINTTTPVDLSALGLSVIVRYRLA